MVWKCRCGHFNDPHYTKCFTCGAPQPGTVEQGEIEYTIILDYVNKGIAEMQCVPVKGPISISTDPNHTRVILSTINSSGASNQMASFEWGNMSPHGNPIHIYPLSEGGFEVSCTSPMFMIDGAAPTAAKNTLESGTILTMSDTMMIKIEDRYGHTFTPGCLSPVGDRMPEGISKDLLFCPEGSRWPYFNGLSSYSSALYMAAGVKSHTPYTSADTTYLNSFILKEYGIKLKRAKDLLKELSQS